MPSTIRLQKEFKVLHINMPSLLKEPYLILGIFLISMIVFLYLILISSSFCSFSVIYHTNPFSILQQYLNIFSNFFTCYNTHIVSLYIFLSSINVCIHNQLLNKISDSFIFQVIFLLNCNCMEGQAQQLHIFHASYSFRKKNTLHFSFL